MWQVVMINYNYVGYNINNLNLEFGFVFLSEKENTVLSQ